MAKSTKIIAALSVAGALGVAALPMASYAADIKDVEDRIKVTVNNTCSFKGETENAATGTEGQPDYVAAWTGTEYSGSALPDAIVDLNGDTGGTDAVHTFKVACNDPKGYTVTAQASGLTGKGLTGDHASIDFMDTATYNTAAGKVGTVNAEEDGGWTAGLTASSTTDYIITDTVAAPDAANAAKIVEKKSATTSAGVTFDVTYKAYVGKSTQAGTYEGKVVYKLTAAVDAA